MNQFRKNSKEALQSFREHEKEDFHSENQDDNESFFTGQFNIPQESKRNSIGF